VLAWLSRFVDVRRGEMRPLVQSFLVLLLIIGGHTILETARDALLLTRFPPGEIGIVYTAVAACALPAAALAARAAVRFGLKQTLVGGLAVAASALVALFFAPSRQVWVLVVYVTSALVGAVLVPLFWSLVDSVFTVAEGRRLLGLIGGAGVLGGALGSVAAAALLGVADVKDLLLVSAAVFLVTGAVLASARGDARVAPQPPSEGALRPTEALRTDPFLGRITLLVVVSTAAMVTVDYYFKWTVAQTVPHDQVAHLVARYYAVLNGLSLVVQLFVSGALVRRIGVANAMVVTPLLVLGGGVGALALGGVLTAVLVLRAIEGTLANSLHRVTTELVYLPVPAADRARTKPFIDGAVARITQAGAGVLLLVLGSAGYLSGWLLGSLVVAFVAVWLGVAATTRGPYLDLLRRAVASDSAEPPADMEPVDLEGAETLLGFLAHEDPLIALGAVNALARRGREQLIPALILLHEDEAVVVRALELFAATDRDDWIGRARRLLADPRESIRMAAARALGIRGRLEPTDLADDPSPRVKSYVALHRALRDSGSDPMENPRNAELLGLAGSVGEEGRMGLLSAIGDSPPSERLSRLLAALAGLEDTSRDWTERLARAVAAQKAESLIPVLVSRLSRREGREAVRKALVTFGVPAMDEVWKALRDGTRGRDARVHLPNTLARFVTNAAAERLLECIETEGDGLVRYKAIRGLGRMLGERGISVDRARVERLACRNVVEYFRLLAVRGPFESLRVDGVPTFAEDAPTERLLTGLLDDKIRQSVERTFRLLKIAHPREDIHRVQIAGISEDRRARANAGEFLDTLLRRHDQRHLRDLLRVVTDSFSTAERVKRARALAHFEVPATLGDALALLVRDSDATVAALATLHVATLAGRPAQVAIGTGTRDGAHIELTTRAWPDAAAVAEGTHA
jgi:AAA family ATP:ADP antiporter